MSGAPARGTFSRGATRVRHIGRPTSGGRRPRLSTRRQRAVLLAAVVVVVTEIATLAGWLPTPALGNFPVLPTLLPALVVAGCLGRAAWGRASRADVVGALWVTVGLGVVLTTVLFARTGDQVDVISIALAAGTEELVYRFSIPVVIAAVLLRLRVPDHPARVAGYGVAAVCFVLLPGHTAQADGFVELLPFIAFAALAAVVVARSGALVAVAGAHTVINLVTVAAADGQISEPARVTSVGILLVLLVIAYGRPAAPVRRPAEPGTAGDAVGDTGVSDEVVDLTNGAVAGERDETTIDLTDQVTEADRASDDRAGADRR